MNSVIDASFLASLLLPDETSNKTTTRAKQIFRSGATAPALLPLEVTNILLMASRRKRITGTELQQLSDTFDTLPISIQPALTPMQRANVLRIAEKHALTAYDAAYLELAMRLDLPLASLDDALLGASKAEGVKAV